MKRFTQLFTAAALIAATFISLFTGHATALEPGAIMISEIKTGGAISGQPTEFFELYNTTNTAINFSASDWWIEYAKPAAQISDCNNNSWNSMDGSANIKQVKLQGTIAANGYLVFELAMNDNAGGSLRLQHGSTIYDLVGWGNSSSQPVCKLGSGASLPPSSKSIHRLFNSGVPVNTDDNNFDFGSPDTPSPTSSEVVEETPEPELPADCRVVSVVEILPNPDGDDTGHEYIELFNPNTGDVSLTGCNLRIGTAIHELSGPVAPGYTALRGYTLPNSAGGQVAYISPAGETVIDYPGGLGDDESYSFIDGTWQRGAQATPGVQPMH
jgi:hypothetical protein